MTTPTGPAYSPARRAGDLLFLTGQLGMADGALVEGGVPAQTRQCIVNIEAILAEHGGTLTDVVKNTVFLTDMADWAAMNEVYAGMFGSPYPCRSAVGAGLVRGALVEIEAIAYLPQ